MSHYHLEVIMPPTADIDLALQQILAQFDENADNETRSSAPFWDWYVVGGRWAGSKLEDRLGADRVQAFRDKLVEMNITVSGFQAGKQTLQPSSQIPVVDALWAEMFPESGITVCPLFSHSNDQYKSGDTLPGDICALSEVPTSTKCARVIIAGPSFSGEAMEAHYMNQTSFWNGVSWIEGRWDGSVLDAVEAFKDRASNYAPEWAAKVMPQENWLAVTVDYHS